MVGLNPFGIEVGSPEWHGIVRAEASLRRSETLFALLRECPPSGKEAVAKAIDVELRVLQLEVTSIVSRYVDGPPYTRLTDTDP